MLLPAWLAFRDTGLASFLSYVVLAGALLALGVAADRERAFDDIDHLVWFTSMTCLAVLLFGGTVFSLAHAFFWIFS